MQVTCLSSKKTLELNSSHSLHSTVVVQSGMLQDFSWIEQLKEVSNCFVILTDTTVQILCGEKLKNVLQQHHVLTHLIAIPPGEQSKTRQWKEWIEDEMLQKKVGKGWGLLLIGGGVVSDLGGFVAATYGRGIPTVNMPTTLLGMVDASIGGKVAVNTDWGKNLIGTFHHPKYVFIDSDFLNDLPERELLNGMAEIIKYALIRSKTLFNKLEDKANFDLNEAIFESCFIKKEIVERDPYEKGERRILNYGHTIAHALEALSDFQLAHGEAVAIGMIVEAYLSFRLGYLSPQVFERIVSVVKLWGFPLKLPLKMKVDRFLEVLTYDKKGECNVPRFVLLENIGNPLSFEGRYCSMIDPTILLEGITWMCSTFGSESVCSN